MFFNSYRKKLIALLLIIASIPIIIIGLGLNSKVKTQVISQGEALKQDYINNESYKIEAWLKSNEDILRIIASNYPYMKTIINSDYAFERVNTYLTSFMVNSESMKNLYITMQDGRNFNSSFKAVQQDTRKRPWYINVLVANESKKPGRIVWSQPYEDSISGDMVISVSMPLLGQGGELEGVIGADFKLQDILDELSHIKISDNSTTYLLIPRGDIYRVNGKDIIGSNEDYIKINSLVANTKNLGKADNTLKLDKEYFIVHSPISTMDWNIVSIAPKKEFYESIFTLNNYIIITIFTTLIVIAILSMAFSKIFTRPLKNLEYGVKQIQKGNYNHKISINDKDEFGQVAKTFNDMSKELQQSYQNLNRQREMLIASNNGLKELNIELEASYEQLKATTDQLNNSEEKYKALVENMHDLVWVISPEGKLEYVNHQVKGMLKYDKSDVVGRDIRDLQKIWVNDFNNVIEDMKKNDYSNLLVTHKDKDGNEIILELNTKRIYEDSRFVGIQGVARDVTKRKAMEEEVLKRNEELSTINKISMNLNSTLNLDSLLSNITKDITEMLDIELCTIRLLDEGDKLKLMAYSGRLSHLVVKDDIPADDDISGRAIKTGNIVMIDNLSSENITHHNKQIMALDSVNYITILPLKTRGKVLGALLATTDGKLEKSDFNILSSLTNQIAMIIENINLYQGLKDNYMMTIKTLAAAVEAKDQYTEGHSLRVSKYGVMIAEYIGLPKKFCEEIEVAGILHDIGKIGISDTILTKPGKLTDEEYQIITNHPMIGARILRNVGFSDVIMNAIKYHHKRYDLKGYPWGDELEELPLEAAIIGVADAFDAMTSSRSYRLATDIGRAIDELVKNKGKQFHPNVVDILVDIYKNNPKIVEDIIKDQIKAS